jgi:hypothetical protein
LAHFAEIDGNNTVLRVVVVSNNDEANGPAFCAGLFGGIWVQTSYNGTIRKNFAGIGYAYDQGRDAFIAPSPYASWVLDEATCQWVAPVPMPEEGGPYAWDEGAQAWVPHEGE